LSIIRFERVNHDGIVHHGCIKRGTLKNHLTRILNNYLDELYGLRIQPSPENRLNKSRKNILQKFKVENILDVGANNGQWALRVREGGFEKKITSFEPTCAFEMLKKNTFQDSNWNCVNMAVSNHTGDSRIYLASNGNLSSSILQPDEILMQGFGIEFNDSIEVPTTTLDEYLSNSQIEEFYLKIDVQGAEKLVLEGVENSVSKCVAVEFESSLRSLYKGESNHYDLAKWLIQRGFTPYQVVITHWDNSMAAISLDSIFIRNMDRKI
jgi:FkbM family methyltransferase